MSCNKPGEVVPVLPRDFDFDFQLACQDHIEVNTNEDENGQWWFNVADYSGAVRVGPFHSKREALDNERRLMGS